jgi:hypothetical protein
MLEVELLALLDIHCRAICRPEFRRPGGGGGRMAAGGKRLQDE